MQDYILSVAVFLGLAVFWGLFFLGLVWLSLTSPSFYLTRLSLTYPSFPLRALPIPVSSESTREWRGWGVGRPWSAIGD